MFHNRDTRSQQNGVSRSGPVAHIVDVGAINTYQGFLRLDEQVARIGSQERAGAKIAGTAPALRPISAYQDCLSTHIQSLECLWPDCSFPQRRHRYTRQVHQLLQREFGKILPVWIAVKWRIDVGSRVAADLVDRDLKGRAWRIG